MKKSQTVETTFSTYQLLQKIGEGGAGEVWRAQNADGSEVAVKILNPSRITKENRKRFANEILFCQRTTHKNIIKILDHGVTSLSGTSAPFYVMPLLHGSFRELMAPNLESTRKLTYFDQLLSGVEAAHLKNVMHRDLKPENVLFDQSSDSVIVADFGIAGFRDEELYTAVETSPQQRLANFLYAAPEQRTRNRLVDFRADIYALGLMLNEIFTGEVPHGTGYKAISSVLPDYGWLDELIDRMIQQDPSKRPESIDAIKRYLVLNRQEFIERQRISEIENKGVSVSQVDDPFINDPPKIVDWAFTNGRLTLILSRPVTREWVNALQNMGSYQSVWGADPHMFTFDQNRAMVSANEQVVQRIIDSFKNWIPLATAKYKAMLDARRRELLQFEQQKIRAEREEIEQQRRLRATIKI